MNIIEATAKLIVIVVPPSVVVGASVTVVGTSVGIGVVCGTVVSSGIVVSSEGGGGGGVGVSKPMVVSPGSVVSGSVIPSQFAKQTSRAVRKSWSCGSWKYRSTQIFPMAFSDRKFRKFEKNPR